MDNTLDTSYQEYQTLPVSREIRSWAILGGKIAPIQRKVNAILDKIASYNNFKGKYKFFVFQSPDTQVLHTQNRKIYIPSGLIKIAKSDDQLAFMLSHEIAHWENQDIWNNQVPIHRSPGQIVEAECLADKKAIEVTIVAWYKKNEIDVLLRSLKNNRPSCEDDESTQSK